MKSLIGFFIVCNVAFLSYNPDLKREIKVKANGISCLVVDDRFETVGSPEAPRTPIMVDCRKEIMWLKPTDTDGFFMFMKENGDCEYE